MPPQKPTAKGTPRRPAPSKPASVDSPVQADDSSTSSDQPSDLAALATILEAAMNSESPARAFERTPSSERLAIETSHHEPGVGHGADAPAQPIRAVTEPPGDPGSPVSAFDAAAFDEVARSLATAEGCVALLAQSSGLMRLAALDVVKGETARAGALLQLLRFLRGEVAPGRLSASSRSVVQRVLQAVESERRLRGVTLVTSAGAEDVACTGDESLLASVLLVLLLCTFGLVESIPNARVTLAVTIADDGSVVFSIGQNHVAAPQLWRARTTGYEFATDAGGIVCALAMSAAFTAAWKWGGEFTVTAPAYASSLALSLPPLRRSTDERLR